MNQTRETLITEQADLQAKVPALRAARDDARKGHDQFVAIFEATMIQNTPAGREQWASYEDLAARLLDTNKALTDTLDRLAEIHAQLTEADASEDDSRGTDDDTDTDGRADATEGHNFSDIVLNLLRADVTEDDENEQGVPLPQSHDYQLQCEASLDGTKCERRRIMRMIQGQAAQWEGIAADEFHKAMRGLKDGDGLGGHMTVHNVLTMCIHDLYRLADQLDTEEEQ